MNEYVNLFNINQLSSCTLACSTHRVDIGSHFDQTGDKVFMQDPSGHVQRRHPITIDAVDISAMYGRQSPVVH